MRGHRLPPEFVLSPINVASLLNSIAYSRRFIPKKKDVLRKHICLIRMRKSMHRLESTVGRQGKLAMVWLFVLRGFALSILPRFRIQNLYFRTTAF